MKSSTRTRKSSASTSTRKSSAAKFSPSTLISKLLTFQTTLKLFHWDTARYAQHKASDQLHTDLSANMDSFVEKMLGKMPDTQAHKVMQQVRVCVKNSQLSLTHVVKDVDSLKAYLTKMRFSDGPANSDLLNIRDEMLGQLNQFLYLIKLK